MESEFPEVSNKLKIQVAEWTVARIRRLGFAVDSYTANMSVTVICRRVPQFLKLLGSSWADLRVF
ncbi:MAG: hypothetical protein N3B10_02230 [Armatimonadetes bacterium]|nr:hypothetical protein [Armatimonadota bacterium]MCX7967288.1 hypothetical protein [Armatimonadota bacterium]MDW8141904.1 hypothetical protein [Armatimonadota bacterium]